MWNELLGFDHRFSLLNEIQAQAHLISGGCRGHQPKPHCNAPLVQLCVLSSLPRVGKVSNVVIVTALAFVFHVRCTFKVLPQT